MIPPRVQHRDTILISPATNSLLPQTNHVKQKVSSETLEWFVFFSVGSVSPRYGTHRRRRGQSLRYAHPRFPSILGDEDLAAAFTGCWMGTRVSPPLCHAASDVVSPAVTRFGLRRTSGALAFRKPLAE